MLGYVDSWDEDDQLFIQTVLCPMGNLSTFLNEYGKHYDRLEEAYIWKIAADVSDVSCQSVAIPRHFLTVLVAGTAFYSFQRVHSLGHQTGKHPYIG